MNTLLFEEAKHVTAEISKLALHHDGLDHKELVLLCKLANDYKIHCGRVYKLTLPMNRDTYFAEKLDLPLTVTVPLTRRVIAMGAHTETWICLETFGNPKWNIKAIEYAGWFITSAEWKRLALSVTRLLTQPDSCGGATGTLCCDFILHFVGLLENLSFLNAVLDRHHDLLSAVVAYCGREYAGWLMERYSWVDELMQRLGGWNSDNTRSDVTRLSKFVLMGGAAAVFSAFETIADVAVKARPGSDEQRTAHLALRAIALRMSALQSSVTSAAFSSITDCGPALSQLVTKNACFRMAVALFKVFSSEHLIHRNTYRDVVSVVTAYARFLKQYGCKAHLEMVLCYKPGKGPSTADNVTLIRHWLIIVSCCGLPSVEYQQVKEAQVLARGIPAAEEAVRAHWLMAQMNAARDDSNGYRKCALPGCQLNSACIVTRLRKCGRCRRAYYCCRDHQKQHWPEHRQRCFPAVR
jgi:hypothetical protein